MNASSKHALLSAAVLAALSILAIEPAYAQEDYSSVGSTSMRARREARRAKQEETKKTEEAPALYPKATREQPGAQASRDQLKALKQLQETYEAGDYAGVMAQADKIAAAGSANAYDKAFAWQLAGTAAAQADDDAKAAQYFQKALDANGLDNNNHYTVMFNLAATQYGLKQNAQALATLDRFLAETKSDKPEQLNLRGALLSDLGRYAEAAALFEKLMAQDPSNPSYMTNAVAAYQQAGQDEKAAALLQQAQGNGALKDANQYRALYVTYINQDQDAKALQVIEDGIAKGIIKPGPDLAKDYMVLGQKAYYAEDDATAIEMYKRAAPMAADGEAALNLAKIYAADGKKAEARAAAKMALEKGVKDTDAAKELAGTGG